MKPWQIFAPSVSTGLLKLLPGFLMSPLISRLPCASPIIISSRLPQAQPEVIVTDRYGESKPERTEVVKVVSLPHRMSVQDGRQSPRPRL